MLKDVNYSLTYSTGSEHEPKEFFTEALIESKYFDLGLGFFSSSGIRCLAYGFALFIANGGKMRVVINHILSEQDKKAIERGQAGVVNDFEDKLLFDVEKLCETLSKEDEQFFRCFSYLISQNRIEFIATVSSQGGLGHDKYGVFTDEHGDKVAFAGSANFSQTAMEINGETILPFTSWEDNKRVKELEGIFNETWSGDTPYLKHIPLDRVTTYIKDKFGQVKLSKLIEHEVDLRDIEELDSPSKKSSCPLPARLIEKIEIKEQEPRFPFPEEREIQKEAYKAWVDNNRQGIFAMATGTGKTVTALNCLLKDYKESGTYKAIIVVPTQALALQWENEVSAFNFQRIVSTHTTKDWNDLLERFITQSKLGIDNKNIIIITTYATFVRDKIQSFLSKVRGIESFTLIADEVHNMGARSQIQKLPINIKKRIGLSATPERVYDEVGSKELYDFFNSKPPQYTYRFTMREAIDAGILCHYDYNPIFITLTDIEMREYKEVTDQLRKFIDPETGKYKEEAQMLLMKRKRIIHKAENKKQATINLLNELSEKGKLQYTFVFVPEGFEPDYSDKDSYIIEDEDVHLIDEYAQIFKEKRYKYHQYISGIEDAPGILESFANGDIDVLLSMKCLDEGVDIPRAEYALFLSSTGNPRQFIQRRGRVLRKHKDKIKATIWDMIVTPPDIEESGLLERNLFMGEVKRIVNFASLADNKIDILYGDLKSICYDLGIDLFGILDEEEKLN